MPAPEIIHQLIHRFEDNLPSYRLRPLQRDYPGR
jgi:hypothetical protein